MPKRREISLLRTLKRKLRRTPRRSLKKPRKVKIRRRKTARNPKKRRNAPKRPPSKRSMSGLMRTSKSTGINSDLKKTKSLSGKSARSLDPKSQETRSQEEKAESMSFHLHVSISPREKEDSSEPSGLLDDNQSQPVECLDPIDLQTNASRCYLSKELIKLKIYTFLVSVSQLIWISLRLRLKFLQYTNSKNRSASLFSYLVSNV